MVEQGRGMEPLGPGDGHPATQKHPWASLSLRVLASSSVCTRLGHTKFLDLDVAGESIELVCTPSPELPPSCGPPGGP